MLGALWKNGAMKPLMALGVLLGMSLPAAAREPAPAPDCVDARQIDDARFADPRTLAMSSGGRRYRLDLAADCLPPPPGVDMTLAGPGGWVCDGAEAFVRIGERTCPVTSVRVIDAREYAVLARSATVHRQAADAVTPLAPVEVRAERRRGFTGSPHFCFNTRDLRAWSQTPAGVQVQVSPRRSGGYHAYQVELEGGCSELHDAQTVEFRSGVGIGQICGNPGDHLKVLNERAWIGITETGLGAKGHPARLCRIRAVYPLDPVPARKRGTR